LARSAALCAREHVILDAGGKVSTVTPSPFRIFLSYRREDSADAAGRLYDQLAVEFGEDNVFIDVDAIPAGVDFVTHINEAVARADVFVALIGRHWLDARNEGGGRRLDDENDFVRVELEAALHRGIPVIPALVQSAQSPSAAVLPNSLAKLARIQGQTLSHERWRYDSGKLIDRLKEIESQTAPQPPRFTSDTDTQARAPGQLPRRRILIVGGATVVVLAAVVSGFLMLRDSGSTDRTTAQGSPTTEGGPTTTVLFEDDFSSDEYGWPNVAEGQIGGRYSNGSYLIFATTPERLAIAAPAAAARAKNVRIDVEAEVTGGSARALGYGYGYGIACRASDDWTDFYRFTVWPQGLIIAKRLDGKATVLKQSWVETGGVVKEMQAGCVTKPGGAVELDFVVNGAEIHARDDEEPFEVGDFGLHAALGPKAGHGETIEVQFDDFAVRQAEPGRR
jgi:hypothetical protein